MLVKEYRILLPLTVQEYRVAQLYMIQKKSRIDSHGADSGVEIITNKPYSEGPGGSGQYTFKIYHIGSKIPVWIRSVLPTTALEAHEEAWNAYPVTKTRYSSPMMDRFSIEVETLYFDDAGVQENVFRLSEEELKNRQVDVMNFVKDTISSHDYCVEEDPRLYRSEKTGRGPLNDDWVEECLRTGQPIMCAYKLCRVEFRYWGMQTRVERWIHDLALRNTMMRAHRQAWAWQDEWVGLSISDVRRLEVEVAEHLSTVMASQTGDDEAAEESPDEERADDASSGDVYFDCYDETPCGKTPMIRWSSELLVDGGVDSPPGTPRVDSRAALLVLVFHGDFSPEAAADSKTTDTHTFTQTVDALIQRHYPQLKTRVHIRLVSCGSELSATVARLSALSPSFGLLHPSLALILNSARAVYQEAVEGTLQRANEVYTDFLGEQSNFSGEVFVVGDAVGGLLLYEVLSRTETGHAPVSRHSSSVSASSRAIPEGREDDGWSLSEFPSAENGVGHEARGHTRNQSAPPSAGFTRKRLSVGGLSFPGQRLLFSPTTAFLLGCPLALVLMQRKLAGVEVERVEGCQVFNLYYPLDPCGARLEPVLQPQLSILPAASVPRYQRFPLGDGRPLLFDSSVDTSQLWGERRLDHLLYCPNAMVALPSSALPNILHASYWESTDVAAFIVRQFLRADEHLPAPTLNPSASMRRRKQIANLSSNHRANDVLVVSGHEAVVAAKFCYGPMDLVALTRENVSVFVCPAGGDWFLHEERETDGHGRLVISLGRSLPEGVHAVKMLVHGDHSFLDAFVAVVAAETRCVIFSVDGSLTASVSVTGKDPRVRPGAVDVVRHWHDHGFLILYMTARPDMQHRVVSAWLAQHNFPPALLAFTPSFSTDPLRQKTQYIRHLLDMGIRVHAAYGSGKDVAVYGGAGVPPDRIVAVSGGRRRSCISIETYSQHLADLQAGHNGLSLPSSTQSLSPSPRPAIRQVLRAHSFTPRTGKYDVKGGVGERR